MLPSLFAIVLLALSSLVHSVPHSVQKRTISSSLLDDFNFFEQYSAAAYCPSNTAGGVTGTKVTCPSAGNCPLVEAANTTTLLQCTLGSVDDLSTPTGFVALDHTNQLVVVAFRGTDTSNIISVLTDLNYFLMSTSPSLCDGCQVHDGFGAAWDAIRNNVLDVVTGALALYPSYEVVATGHSAGAAIATIGAADLRNNGLSVSLYTYGCPRTGNQAFADLVTSSANPSYRVTHHDDPVPLIPLQSMGFAHFGPQYWISSGNNVGVTTADVIDCGNQDPPPSSTGCHIPLLIFSDENDHQWYFNEVAQCAHG